MFDDQNILEIKNLSIDYLVGNMRGRVVENANVVLKKGKVLGLAGESGCGKSTLAWSILRLLPTNARIVSGDIIFEGISLLNLTERDMNKKIRGKQITMLIQNTRDSLNPVFPISTQMSDLLRFHDKNEQRSKPIFSLNPFYRSRKKKERLSLCIKMLDEMEIAAAAKRILEYPHQFSGGMRQRVMMAMSFITNPSLLIVDEPTTGLDVSVEAYILDLFKQNIKKYHTSVLYITHNLRVLSEMADKIAIMYAGVIVEEAPSRELLRKPTHPYTLALLQCLPEKGQLGKRLQEIPGQVPSIFERPSNCKFEPRCQYSSEICLIEPPPAIEVSSSHSVLCHNFSKVRKNAIA
jgi:oligopeptide/dipeptide ABC transporter ATP-binding protein